MADYRFNVITGGKGGGPTPPLDPGSGGGDDGGMDELVRRVARLEDAVVSIRDAIGRLEPRIIETHTFTTVIVPTLATKAEVADLRVSLTETTAAIPTLATRAEIADLKVTLSEATATIPTLASRAEVADLKVTLSEATATIPALASKTDLASVLVQLADKPGKLYLWGMVGVLVATLAAGAVFTPLVQKALGP